MLRFAREIGGRIGSAMRREDTMFVGDAKLIKRIDAMAHRFPIRLAAHNDRDEWF